jgi:glycerol uptake operon antiterminator
VEIFIMSAPNNSSGSRLGSYSSDRDDHEIRPDLAVASEAWKRVAESTIIAAVNNPEALSVALDSPTKTIYLLTGNPLTIPDMLARTRDRGKVCLVNIDFIDGLSRDKHAVEFLAAHKVAGVVSTRSDTLRAAKAQGLITVQRTFAIDSAAVQATVRSLAQFLPDAIEILPAPVAPRVLPRFRELHAGLQIIAGGLIEGVQEIETLLAAGVNSVSVSKSRLWII